MSSADATLKMVLLGEDKSASKALNTAGATAKKTEGHFHSLGKIAAGVFAGGALFEGAEKGIDFLKESAKEAANEAQANAILARQMHNTTGATHEQISATEEWLKKTGEANGITRQQLVPAFTQLTTATGSVTKSHKLLNLAMDASAGTGKSLSTITGALVRAQNGSVVGLSRLGIATKNADGTTKKFGAVIKDMSAHFKGDAKTSAESAAGQYRRLGVMFEDLKISIGQKLLPILTKMGDWFFTKGIPAIQQTARFLGGQLRSALDALKPVIDKVKDALGHLTPIFDRVGDFIKKNPGTVKVFVGVLLGLAVAIGLVSAAMVVLDAVMDANPVMLVVIALAALAAGFYYAYTHSKKFREVVQATLAATKAVISGFVHAAVAVWHAFGGNIIAVAKAAWGMVKGVIGGQLKIIQGLIKVITSAIHGNWSGVWQGLKLIVSGAFQTMVAIVKGYLGILLGLVKGLPGKIVSAVGNLAMLLYNAGKAIVQGLINGIESMASSLMSKVSSLAGKVSGAFKGALGIHSPSRVFIGHGADIIKGLVQGIESQARPLQTVLDKVIAAVKSAGDRLHAAISARNSFAGGFSSFASSVFGMSPEQDANGNDLPVTAASIIAAQQAQAKNAHMVKTDVRKLIKMGLSKSLIKQLQAAGPAGEAQLQALASATPSQIAALNKANAQTGADLHSAGMSAGNAIYGKEIAQDRHRYNETKKVLTEIRDAVKHQNTKDLVARIKGSDLEIVLTHHKRVNKGSQKLAFQ